MKELLKKYENKEPEIVFHWNDPEFENVKRVRFGSKN